MTQSQSVLRNLKSLAKLATMQLCMQLTIIGQRSKKHTPFNAPVNMRYWRVTISLEPRELWSWGPCFSALAGVWWAFAPVLALQVLHLGIKVQHVRTRRMETRSEKTRVATLLA